MTVDLVVAYIHNKTEVSISKGSKGMTVLRRLNLLKDHTERHYRRTALLTIPS